MITLTFAVADSIKGFGGHLNARGFLLNRASRWTPLVLLSLGLTVLASCDNQVAPPEVELQPEEPSYYTTTINCPNCRFPDSAEWGEMEQALTYICEEYRDIVMATFYMNQYVIDDDLWGGTGLRGTWRGWHNENHSNSTHMGLAPGLFSTYATTRDVARTMTHEYLHHRWVGEPEEYVSNAAYACTG